MPELTADSAVLFADWVYEVEQAVGGLSDKASRWFSLCLKAASEAYDLYQVSDPLTRLSLEPVRSEELCEERWRRLERRVLTLMLATLRKQAKDDAVTHRINTVPGLLYRLHILYAPGSAAERATILRQLEGQPGTTSIVDTVVALRKWRRQLQRADEMRVSIPDSSLLLRGVETLASRAVEANASIVKEPVATAVQADAGECAQVLRSCFGRASTGSSCKTIPDDCPHEHGSRWHKAQGDECQWCGSWDR